MPRKARLIIPGATYHVFCRGNRKEKIFINNKDRLKFLNILLDAKDKFPVNLYAFTLIPNHPHFLLKPVQPENLSKFMHYINTCYSIYINKKYNLVGHLLQDRFKSIPIDSEPYLWKAWVYIHINSVKHNLVQQPEEYKWSSYPLYLEEIKKIPPRFYTRIERQLLEKIIDKEIFLKTFYPNFEHDRGKAIEYCKKLVDEAVEMKIWLKDDWHEHDI